MTIVTGGASGLGKACVRDLVKWEGKVSIFDISVERGEKIAAELGSAIIFCRTDITDEKTVKSAVDKTMKSFGAIHVVINCAGGGYAKKVLGKEGPMPIDYFNGIVQLNLIGTFNVIRLTAEKMVKNTANEDGEKGVIINTASIAAFDGQIGQAPYSASKSGVVGMTLPIAREFADYGIRVVTIAPGVFLTPLAEGLPQAIRESVIKEVPFPKRFGKPSEFSQLVKQIIENPMLNGNTIRLDAALRMSAR